MKKWSLLASAAVIPILAISVVSFTHKSDPVATKLSAVHKPVNTTQTEQTTTPATEAPQTAPVAAPQSTRQAAAAAVTTPQPTPEQNRAKLQETIETAAKDNLSKSSKKLTPDLMNQYLYSQWACVDRVVGKTSGYSDYAAALSSPIVQFLLVSGTDEAGNPTYRYFDSPGSCRFYNLPT